MSGNGVRLERIALWAAIGALVIAIPLSAISLAGAEEVANTRCTWHELKGKLQALAVPHHGVHDSGRAGRVEPPRHFEIRG